jgi:hypothetical protein
MKKTILLAAAMLLAFAQGAWAACVHGYGTSPKCCMYENSSAKCYGVDGQYDEDDGVLQTSATCVQKGGRVVDDCEDVLVGLEYCRWTNGECWQIADDDERDNCEEYGSIYTDVPSTGIGVGKKCQGGKWTGEGRNPDAVMLGCCNWKGEGCFAVWEGEETKWATCKSSERWLTCPNDKAGTCPATGGPSSSSSPSNSSSSARVYAFCIYSGTGTCTPWSLSIPCPSSGELSDTCPYSSSSSNNIGLSSSSNGDVATSSSSGDDSSTNFLFCVFISDRLCLEGPHTISTCPPGIANLSNSCPFPDILPIFSRYSVSVNKLTAMQNAVNLQSTRNAVVQIFDLKGKAVRTLRFSQGSYVVPLSGLPKGLYIVKASNGSWKQTIKVTVK